jgi:hypothetical protein
MLKLGSKLLAQLARLSTDCWSDQELQLIVTELYSSHAVISKRLQIVITTTMLNVIDKY